MIDFPASPINGQIFTSGAQSWTWDGTKWVASGIAVMPPLSTGDNRIINGDMRIDQRNNGASGTGVGIYTIDRWQYIPSQTSKGTWGRNLNAITGPPGFPYYLGFQSSSAYAALAADYFEFAQPVEADMVSDFAWGTVSAQPVTVSFWAYSSLTGTFSGSIQNYASTRSYPFIYSLPAANTWTKIFVIVPGDTSGAWVMSGNGGALQLCFDLGSGSAHRGAAGVWGAGYTGATGAVSPVSTNGATFYVTGVKLEVGSVATPYNRQSLAKSMADCQRYYQTNNFFCGGYAGSTGIYGHIWLPVQMRAAPTATFSGVSYSNGSAIGSTYQYATEIQIAWTATAGSNSYAAGIFQASAEL